jgi:hypothetical protein
MTYKRISFENQANLAQKKGEFNDVRPIQWWIQSLPAMIFWSEFEQEFSFRRWPLIFQIW